MSDDTSMPTQYTPKQLIAIDELAHLRKRVALVGELAEALTQTIGSTDAEVIGAARALLARVAESEEG